MALLEVDELAVRFQTRAGAVSAVEGVSFSVDHGETVGIVGESGSGKSVTSLALMGILPGRHTTVSAKRLSFDGTDLLTLSRSELRNRRGRDLAMIFQNPTSSLNPIIRIGTQITEALQAHDGMGRREAGLRAVELLEHVGIADPERVMRTYPHRLSGGMCQRVMIAIALGLRPKLLIADEPTTALDVTVQAQVLELIRDLAREAGTAVILITHDLGVVAAAAQRVNVMYAGRIVESGATTDVFGQPHHPYTAGLLRSATRSDRDRVGQAVAIPGQPPDAAMRAPGCAFAPRCARSTPACVEAVPPMTALGDPADGHAYACFHPLTEPVLAHSGGGSR